MEIEARSFTVGIIRNDKYISVGKPTSVNNGAHKEPQDVCTT